ncbi:hypothetical protein TSOC_005724 [Tetrabaena socialis]|uniref:Protein kinase domain-containing protein n=1 Tax=Tetrabaena socialis TaxID=47790 RepID=A0A2J8A5I4_9CHLO|nr:hypothetical protein TSOC_005724 [Tetrabaena socialis]|eukprot:PNH07789.1 hypothetical protein TSOC_005724 [Tetrabaena socialis]
MAPPRPLSGSCVVIRHFLGGQALRERGAPWRALGLCLGTAANRNRSKVSNYNLAETTKSLEEEKERMDVLLLRQYDLLRCLDANRSKGGVTDIVNSSKKAMMARIEDARRSLNVATTSVEDPIQVFELLGAGASAKAPSTLRGIDSQRVGLFGKVQRGLWRGTVVAVKTMILPANMTGQVKREKMAVMEAAISSSLVHPNIVTTYTYFIRPYHEPVHSGVQNMLASQAGVSMTKQQTSDTQTSASSEESSTIHSYEVRLVLEFCDKGSLKDALDQQAFLQGGAFNLCAMLETAGDVAKAMVHMHAANVLHSVSSWECCPRRALRNCAKMEEREEVSKEVELIPDKKETE